jgi:hypothetical protein
MKRLLIKIFRLDQIEVTIYRAIKKQEQYDAEQFSKDKIRMREIHTQEINLLKQELHAKIHFLEDKILEWEARRKSMEDREYKAKVQIKTNFNVAQQIASQTQAASLTFLSEIKSLQGIFDEASEHNEKIKKIGK